MKNFFFLISLILTVAGCVSSPDEIDLKEVSGIGSVIPMPVSVIRSESKIKMPSQFSILVDDNSSEAALLLSQKIQSDFGIFAKIIAFQSDDAFISIKKGEVKNKVAGAYSFEISETGIVCRVFDEEGAFNFVQTFLQMIIPGSQEDLLLEVLKVDDYPQYHWRGLMVDVGRHFFPKETILDYIDTMSRYKFNILHLHLTEDQGWRIEIKSRPELTKVGSIRGDTRIGVGSNLKYVGEPHSGFFTQDDIREIVKFAEARGIMVVPEIDMPGHMVSAVASYPELSCRGAPVEVRQEWGVSLDLLCPGKDSTFEFIDDVIQEVSELFPSKYLHLGGDEAPLDRWKECPHCQKRIAELGLKDEHEFMGWFFNKAAGIAKSYGKQIMAWHEDFDHPDGTPLFLWRKEASSIRNVKALADRGFPIIFTPGVPTYFDYKQWGSDPNINKSDVVSLKGVYDFDLAKYDKVGADIWGSQGNLWSEYIHSREMLFFQTYPRAFALSEALWLPKGLRNWEDFISRTANQLSEFDKSQIMYRPFDNDLAAEILKKLNEGRY
ncbi:MAG: beta-N-acetylhexosaminidase [Spirochaetales bacterium]|nr:beta-N-acetylhexosaminidase [Spirochaetales bacterium]